MRYNPVQRKVHEQAHRASRDVMAVLMSLDPQAQVALTIFLVDVADALEDPDEGRRNCTRELVMDVLSLFPGLVEEEVRP